MSDPNSDSDSSSECGVVGNVSKQSVLEPSASNSGDLKKGRLVFDACFESGECIRFDPFTEIGNLGRVDFINDYEYDLFIRPDTCNTRFRVWFNFTVQNCYADQRVIFHVVNSSKVKSLYREGMAPLVKSTSRPFWCRIPSKNVFYYRCPDHRKNYVLSFVFCFDVEEDTYQFCYCIPYTYTRLQNYLEEIENRSLPYFKRELLGKSVQQRRLDLLTITHPANLVKTHARRRRIVFITSRVHPGETPASFVCEGLIDFLISDHPKAEQLRNYIIFKIVPMLNPDGVYLGNYRCSLMGFDLNRHWNEPSPWAHPTIVSCKHLLVAYDKNPDIQLNFFVDIHAHSTLLNGFIYGNVYEDEHRCMRQSIFPQLFSKNAEDFSMQQTNFNRDAVKAGTGRRTLGGLLDDKSMCYTLEVSFFGYKNCTTGEVSAYTEESYARLGRNLAVTFHEYYSSEANLLDYRPIEIKCLREQAFHSASFDEAFRREEEHERSASGNSSTSSGTNDLADDVYEESIELLRSVDLATRPDQVNKSRLRRILRTKLKPLITKPNELPNG